jgi:hypothetical protein
MKCKVQKVKQHSKSKFILGAVVRTTFVFLSMEAVYNYECQVKKHAIAITVNK